LSSVQSEHLFPTTELIAIEDIPTAGHQKLHQHTEEETI
jgi:hypothetical protein